MRRAGVPVSNEYRSLPEGSGHAGCCRNEVIGASHQGIQPPLCLPSRDPERPLRGRDSGGARDLAITLGVGRKNMNLWVRARAHV